MIDEVNRKRTEKLLCCLFNIKENNSGHHFTVDDGECHTCTRFGSTIHIYGKREGYFPYHAVLGPDWPIVLLVYVLIIGAHLVVLGGVYQLGYLVTIIGGTGCFFLLAMYSATACSDPGTIFAKPPAPAKPPLAVVSSQPLNITSVSPDDYRASNIISDIESNNNRSSRNNNSSNIDNNNSSSSSSSEGSIPPASGTDKKDPFRTLKWHQNPDGTMIEVLSDPVIQELRIPDTIECGHCDLRRPYSARHCSYCKYCVDELDHHCPWCGKCIGENNISFFNCFLGALCFQSYFLIGVVIYYIVFAIEPTTPSGPHY